MSMRTRGEIRAFSNKVKRGEIEKGMQDAIFILSDEFRETEDGKSFCRLNGRKIKVNGVFMVTAGSFIPYVIVDKTIIRENVRTIEKAIRYLDRVLYHELTHQLCPSEWTWNEKLPCAVEDFLVDERPSIEIPVIEVIE